MRAAFYQGTRTFITGEMAPPRPGPDDVLLRVRGTVSIVAMNLYQMFARELVMHGSRLYARADWEEAIRLVASGAVPVAPLVSRRIPLEALQRGMEEALGGGPVMKALVEV
jgi:threonine dehydrogenase-like Zn-dependent dehydrogenase